MNTEEIKNRPLSLEGDGDEFTLLVMEHKSMHPDNSTWSVFNVTEAGFQDFMWEMQGHQVLHVNREEAKRLLDKQKIALELQLELREKFYTQKEKRDAEFDNALEEGGQMQAQESGDSDSPKTDNEADIQSDVGTEESS